MPQLKTHAIVLRRADYRENDRMLTLFSPELGRIDALSRGCRRQKSPLMAASEVFAVGEYVLYQTAERATVVSCQLEETYYPLRQDFDRLAHGMYALELCAAAVQEGQENERLFLLLLKCLAHLCYGETQPRRVTAVFLMGMTSLLGFRPVVKRCISCGKPLTELPESGGFVAAFDAENGGVLCGECGYGAKCRLHAENVRYLQEIMRTGVESLDQPGECPDGLFAALREFAETRLDVPIRSGKMLG